MHARRDNPSIPAWRGDEQASLHPPEVEAPYFDSALRAWVVSRHRDILAVLRHERAIPASVSGEEATPASDEALRIRLRAETQEALSPSLLRQWRQALEPEPRALSARASHSKRTILRISYPALTLKTIPSDRSSFALSQATATRVIAPARNLLGSLRLPGDKSISHRYALLGGLAHGTTHLENFSTGADPASSLGCVAALGANVERDGASVTIQGCGGRFQPANAHLDCGNSGSTMRMLAGLLAAQQGSFTLIGDSSLSRRPMERIRKPLEAMGAHIALTEGHAPLSIDGGPLRAIDYTTPVPSAQVKTAVLFAGLHAHGTTTVTEAIRTRDHGEIALEAFGVKLAHQLNSVSIAGGQPLQGVNAVIPGDISSAAFFLCAAALFPDSGLLLDNLGLNPTRATLLDVLATLGAKTSVLNLEHRNGELAGTVQLIAPKEGLSGATISGALAAQLIDELPVLAAIAPYTRNGIRIRDAKELRVKESDRIALVAENLRRMGAEVTEVEDGMDVPGGQTLHGAEIDSGGDHRIAMAFSVAALRATGESTIHGAESADISFPEFFSLLDQVTVR